VMTGVSSLGDLFSNVSRQIIADLIRIALQKTIVGTLSNVLFGGSKVAGALGGGGASFGSSSLPSSIFDVKLDGARAGGGPVWAGGTFLVGEKGPELFTPGTSGSIIANDNLRAPRISARDMAPAPPIQIVKVMVEANDYFDARVDQRSAGIAAPMATHAGLAGSAQAQQSIRRRARNRIPG